MGSVPSLATDAVGTPSLRVAPNRPAVERTTRDLMPAPTRDLTLAERRTLEDLRIKQIKQTLQGLLCPRCHIAFDLNLLVLQRGYKYDGDVAKTIPTYLLRAGLPCPNRCGAKWLGTLRLDTGLEVPTNSQQGEWSAPK